MPCMLCMRPIPCLCALLPAIDALPLPFWAPAHARPRFFFLLCARHARPARTVLPACLQTTAPRGRAVRATEPRPRLPARRAVGLRVSVARAGAWPAAACPPYQYQTPAPCILACDSAGPHRFLRPLSYILY